MLSTSFHKSHKRHLTWVVVTARAWNSLSLSSCHREGRSAGSRCSSLHTLEATAARAASVAEQVAALVRIGCTDLTRLVANYPLQLILVCNVLGATSAEHTIWYSTDALVLSRLGVLNPSQD
jgi:hypothetical protein